MNITLFALDTRVLDRETDNRGTICAIGPDWIDVRWDEGQPSVGDTNLLARFHASVHAALSIHDLEVL